MALSEDQRALLRLLLDGEDYDSIGDLLGEDPGVVRDRAHLALQEAGPVDPELAGAVRDRLAQLEGTAPAAGPAAAEPSSSRNRLALWLPLTLGVIAIAVVVLVVSGAFDEDQRDSAPPGPDREDVVVIPLKPVGGVSAKGSARLIRIEDLPVLDVDVIGLDPSPAGEAYILWLYNSPRRAFPLAPLQVGANGRLEGRVSIPSGAVALLPNFDGLDVSLARNREAAAAVREAAQGGGIPRHVGRSVVRGRFPGA